MKSEKGRWEAGVGGEGGNVDSVWIECGANAHRVPACVGIANLVIGWQNGYLSTLNGGRRVHIINLIIECQ